MAKYQKTNVSMTGKWVKAVEIQNGSKAKLVSETVPTPSQFFDKKGNPKTQDVAKIRFEHLNETLNISLNRATINGLIDAFGDESSSWQGHHLTVVKMQALVGGKMQWILYLIPEGYALDADENGYPEIKNIKDKTDSPPNDVEIPIIGEDEENKVKVEDLPF